MAAMTGCLLAVLAAAFAGPAHAGKEPKDSLVIGITQFPSTFHPNIDAMLAKTYILALTRRPLTAYDAEWQLVCMLCVKLPTIENGLAVPEKTPDGKSGIAVTYTIRPDANWGDGTPVTTKDIVFTWKVGRHRKSGVGNMEFYRSLYKIDVKDAKTFTMHFDKLTFQYNAINGFELIPAHLDEDNFADPVAYKNRTAFDTDTTNQGLYYGPYRIDRVVTGSHVVLVPNPTWWGRKPHFKRIVVRGTLSGALIQAYMAIALNLRSVTVCPKKTRAGSFLMRTSMPNAFHWLCSTCSTSSRDRLPAVVMISRPKRLPFLSWRMPRLPTVQPASFRSFAAFFGS